jgi:hypothetical protein
MLAEGFGVDENDWKKDKNGNWVAQKGDSAGSLAKDADISYEHANRVVQTQHGKNKKDSKGNEFSNIKEGDVVVVSTPERDISGVLKTAAEKELPSVQLKDVQESIDNDIALINNNEKKIDSMEQVKEKMDAKTQLLEDAGVFEGDGSDPSTGPHIYRMIRQAMDFFKKRKIDKVIKKKNNTIDSLKKEIKRKEKIN